jgi:glycosyltransferase involved in cell wall biosynthesis
VVLHTRVVAGSGGGPDKTILNSGRFLAPEYRTLCAYMHPPRDPGFEQLQDKARRWEAPLVSIPDRGPWDWRVVSQLLKLCRAEHVTIWHGHDYKSNALGLLVRCFWPMHLVTTVHGWVSQTRRTPLYYAIDRLCLPYYERVICVSGDLHERCLAAGVRRQRCVVIENAIDTEDFRRRRERSAAKAGLGFPGHAPLIGAIGRLAGEKGFDLLIRATDLLLREGLDVRLVIVGEGEAKGHLQALIAELGREQYIQLAGYQPNVQDYLEALEVFALSSLREGLPNVLLESMAMEVPVVATRVAGIPRLVRDEQNGLSVPAGDVPALAGAMRRLVTDLGLATRLGIAGRQTIESEYSFRVRMEKISRLYAELLRGR